MLRFIYLFSVVLLINGCNDQGADLTEKAKVLIQSEKYSQSVELLEQAVEMENADAEYELGKLYESGKGVIADEILAMELFIKAAEKGNVDAQHKAGENYIHGIGVEKNLETAAGFFLNCANAGRLDCMVRIITMYRLGLGVEKDTDKFLVFGVKLASHKLGIDSADNQIIMHARVNMARIYLFGDGLETDTIESYKWMLLYNENKSLLSEKSQANMFTNIRLAEEGLSEAQRKEAASRAELLLGERLKNTANLYIIE